MVRSLLDKTICPACLALGDEVHQEKIYFVTWASEAEDGMSGTRG